MKITMKLLLLKDACARARRVVGPLLPLTFHIDPEKNIDIACKLITAYTESCGLKDCQQCRGELLDDLRWLANAVNYKGVKDVYELSSLVNMPYNIIVLLAAQAMAIIADA